MFSCNGETHSWKYTQRFCVKTCYAAAFYRNCSCFPNDSSDIMNSICLEGKENRKCLVKAIYGSHRIAADAKNCLASCLPKCIETKIKTSVLKDSGQNSAFNIKTTLEEIINLNKENSLAAELLDEINMDDNNAAAEKMIANVAQLSFYFRQDQQMVTYEVRPLMTFSTFLSNVGGLLEMWLGVSVISILKLFEQTVNNLLRSKKNVEATS